MNVAVLISGAGTTLHNLLQKKESGELDADFDLVISSSPDAGGLAYAAGAQIPARVVRREVCRTPEQFRDKIFAPCRDAGVDYVLMGGFLKHVLIPADFTNRVLNIHPALIPACSGKGYYGLHVHQAVLASGAKVSGCTVHFVDDEYDHGPILLQRVVPVAEGDTPESLAKRVFAAECEAYPEAIRLLASGDVRVEGRRVGR
jgi:phosphoribosylglycinamide formyltransferase-1